MFSVTGMKNSQLSEKAPTPVKKIGIYDVFGESGSAKELIAKYKLDATGIYEQVKASLCDE